MFAELLNEKYRPQVLDDIIGNTEAIKLLKRYVETGSTQNLFFSGPAGVGKTTAALCLGSQLNAEVKEMNASDSRGIEVVRGEIKNFAGSYGFDISKIKICILDEVDFMTKDAQAALRRTMEKFSSNCRFILCCNHPNKVDGPIKFSRCLYIPFRHPTSEEIIARLTFITQQEKKVTPQERYKEITDLCHGDVRQAINMLEITFIKPDIDLGALFGSVRPGQVHKFFQFSCLGQFRSTASILAEMDEMTAKAYFEELDAFIAKLPDAIDPLDRADVLVYIGQAIDFINEGTPAPVAGQYIAGGICKVFKKVDVLGELLKQVKRTN